jgi:hypothetical protein
MLYSTNSGQLELVDNYYRNTCLQTFPCHGLNKFIKAKYDFITVELKYKPVHPLMRIL